MSYITGQSKWEVLIQILVEWFESKFYDNLNLSFIIKEWNKYTKYKKIKTKYKNRVNLKEPPRQPSTRTTIM